MSPLRSVRAQSLDRRPPGVAGAVAGLGLRERAVQSNLNRRARPTRGHRQSLLRLDVTRGSSCMPRATHAPIPRTILTARVPAIQRTTDRRRSVVAIGRESLPKLSYPLRCTTTIVVVGRSSSRIPRPRRSPLLTPFARLCVGNWFARQDVTVQLPFRRYSLHSLHPVGLVPVRDPDRDRDRNRGRDRGRDRCAVDDVVSAAATVKHRCEFGRREEEEEEAKESCGKTEQ